MNVGLNIIQFACVMQNMFPVKKLPVTMKESPQDLRRGAVPGSRGHRDPQSTKIYFWFFWLETFILSVLKAFPFMICWSEFLSDYFVCI
jgi:hypothetical protein